MTTTKQTKEQLLENRRNNMRWLIEQYNGVNALSKRLGYNTPSYLVQMAGPNPTRNVSAKTARTVEMKLSLTDGWMDMPPEAHNIDVTALGANRAEPRVLEMTRVSSEPTDDAPVATIPPQRRAQAASDQMPSTIFVTDIIKQAGQVAEDTGVQLPPSKLAEVIAMAYQDAQEHGNLRISFIQQIMRLLK